MRTDNWGEYMGEFMCFLNSQSIRHHITPPKTSQRNGVVVCMNKTLMEKVQSMLAHAKLAKDILGRGLEYVLLPSERGLDGHQVMTISECLSIGPLSMFLQTSNPR